jgi:hypothetical protein
MSYLREVPTRFYGPLDLTTSPVAVLTNPAEAGSGTKRVLDQVVFANHSNTTVLVTAYINGTAEENEVVPSMVAPGDGVLEAGGYVLEAGDTFYAKAATAARVALVIFGRDIQP